MAIDIERTFKPINIAVLTVSDTRTAADLHRLLFRLRDERGTIKAV